MTNKAIKEKWLEILKVMATKDGIDDDDFDEYVDLIIMMLGGWCKIYEDIRIGEQRGMTAENQLIIAKELMNDFIKNNY